MSKHAVILIGPPGAGKDTQADLLVDDFGFEQIKSSKIIEAKFASADPNDSVMQEQIAIFKAGKLNDPALVRQWIMEEVEHLAAQGKSLVFSGSPRTVDEVEHEAPRLEELFGKENVHVVHIKVGGEESINRNSHRRICEANRHPIPNFPEFENLTTCPKDGSKLVTRVLDNDETMRVRYKTYLEQTAPVLDYFREHGYTIIEVNGEQSIRDVHKDILIGIDMHEHTDLEKKLNDSIGTTN